MNRYISASAIAVSTVIAGAQTDTTFTYQGELTESGSAATGQFDLAFDLWDAAAAGNQIGATVDLGAVDVVDGLFTVELDFGAGALDGSARWLEIEVDGQTLAPRQPLTRSPYAIQTRGLFVDGNELVGIGTLAPEHELHVAGDVLVEGRTAFGNDAAIGLGAGPHPTFDRIHDFSHTITDFSSSNLWAPLLCTTTLDPMVDLGAAQVYCNAFEAHIAEGNDKDVLFLTGLTGGAVHNGTGRVVNFIGELVFADSRSSGEIVHSTALGVVGGGHFESEGVIQNNVGISIQTGHNGIDGSVQKDTGLLIQTPRAARPIGTSYGIYLEDQNVGRTASYAIYSEGGDVFLGGDVEVGGILSKGGGSFRIDHPLDPKNKYLSHSFVESPDMMNIYNGRVSTDEAGYATVVMPDWFEALNRDFRYQLTVIDGADSDSFAMAKIVREIDDGRFTIRTSEPDIEVSWQVTGIRQDAFANAHRIPVEQDKPLEERGSYLHPDAFGVSRTVDHVRTEYSVQRSPVR